MLEVSNIDSIDVVKIISGNFDILFDLFRCILTVAWNKLEVSEFLLC